MTAAHAASYDPAAEPGDAAPQWPAPMADAAYHGLAGRVVRAILPHTEADAAALLASFLAAAGSAMGRGPHFVADGARHGANLFAVLVGRTSKGRKGTAWANIRRVMQLADPEWAERCIATGLSSGEGLITAVRDDAASAKGAMTPGVPDKRLLCLASEYAAVLQVIRREGNTLSAVLRDAWDRGDLRTCTRRDPLRATGAHISLMGHITADELRRSLTETEAASGFGNRHLFYCCARSKVLPEGGSVPEAELAALAGDLREVMEWARPDRELRRDDAARKLWAGVYPDLSDAESGLLGAVTSRAEAQVMRLALIYAVLDRSALIRAEHLAAAGAAWNYAHDSCRWIFGEAVGDPVADAILGAVRQSADGMTRTAIRDLGGRHWTEGRVAAALRELAATGHVRQESTATGGRPAEVWRAVR